MKQKIEWFNEKMAGLKDIPLLMLRLILAYGFYSPAVMKLTKPAGVAKFFERMEIPFPLMNVYIAGVTEALGVILLVLGFGTRLIAIPLMVTMFVAIYTVHWDNGFAASDKGIQIPLYFLIMLFTLLAFGSGKISIDYLIGKKRK